MLDPWIASVTMIRSLANGSAPHPSNIGSATGFFYKYGNEKYLITNKHVVINTNINFYPDHLCIKVHTSQTNLLPNRDINIALYNRRQSSWLEHLSRENIDIVAININHYLEPNDFITWWSSNYFPQQNVLIGLGEQVVVMGYPMAFYDRRHNLPISRSGTMASLYGAHFEGKPYFLIDTNLHPGTSGSPVYVPRSLSRKTTTGYLISDDPYPPMLLGIHSGEYTKGDVKLGLNIVWYANLIQEIVEQ